VRDGCVNDATMVGRRKVLRRGAVSVGRRLVALISVQVATAGMLLALAFVAYGRTASHLNFMHRYVLAPFEGISEAMEYAAQLKLTAERAVDTAQQPDLVRIVRLVVEEMGVDVLEAKTCVEGIAALGANHDRIRLVLLDYFMPGMDPASCVRELNSLASRTMIVLCTAAADATGRAIEVGLARVLGKPFTLDTLKGLVREATRYDSAITVPTARCGSPRDP
jgi:CheY-like chemotaxis protein